MLPAVTIARNDSPVSEGCLRMLRVLRSLHHLVPLTCTLLTLLVDAARFLRLGLRSPTALAAANLFLRTQLALYQERHVTPRRATDATRLALVWLGRWFDWRQALADLCAQSCPGHRRVCFLWGGHRHCSPALRVCGDGARHAPHAPLQCDGPSHRPLGAPAAARSYSR